MLEFLVNISTKDSTELLFRPSPSNWRTADATATADSACFDGEESLGKFCDTSRECILMTRFTNQPVNRITTYGKDKP